MELSPEAAVPALPRAPRERLRSSLLKEPAAASGFMFTWQREVESPRSLKDWKREPEPAGGPVGALAVAYAWPSPHRPEPWGPEPVRQRDNQTEPLAFGKEVKVVQETNNTSDN